MPRVLVDVSEVDPSSSCSATRCRCRCWSRRWRSSGWRTRTGRRGWPEPPGRPAPRCASRRSRRRRPRRSLPRRPDTTRWFQLYCFSDRAVTEALLAEAVESGYRGDRADRGCAVRGPPRARPPQRVRGGRHRAGGSGGDRLGSAGSVAEVFGLVDPTLDWDALATLCAGCELPILLKGLMAPADAELAIEAGAGGSRRLEPRRPAARWRSGHGGRAAGGRRRGRGPGSGPDGRRRAPRHRRRSSPWRSAQTPSSSGARRCGAWRWTARTARGSVLELLRDEIRLALALLGCRTPADVTRAHVQRTSRLSSCGDEPWTWHESSSRPPGARRPRSSDRGLIPRGRFRRPLSADGRRKPHVSKAAVSRRAQLHE